jgi:hypothetical protein
MSGRYEILMEMAVHYRKMLDQDYCYDLLRSYRLALQELHDHVALEYMTVSQWDDIVRREAENDNRAYENDD